MFEKVGPWIKGVYPTNVADNLPQPSDDQRSAAMVAFWREYDERRSLKAEGKKVVIPQEKK